MALLREKANVKIKPTLFTKKKLEYWVKFFKKTVGQMCFPFTDNQNRVTFIVARILINDGPIVGFI